ncbi:DUF188 domain-containing protein [Mycobacterium sp. C31M]
MRYIVDAMNVIGSRPDGWWRDRTGAIRTLVDRLERWADTEGAEVTVVLEKPLPIASASITVVSAPAAAPDSADDEIVALVTAAEDPAAITVVTSDAGLAARVHAAGAATRPAGGFRALLD